MTLVYRKLVVSDEYREVNSDGTLVVRAATIEDDGMYACHVRVDGRPVIYRYLLQVQGKYCIHRVHIMHIKTLCFEKEFHGVIYV